MSTPVRLFVAVPCGEHLAQALSTALDGQPAGRFLRWSSPETWHLTLHFLGDWPQSRVPELSEALQGVTDTEAFTLPIGGLGAFPDLKGPRVLFLHLEDDGSAARLAGRIREKVAGIWPEGPQDNREFKPHLTLSRIRKPLQENELNMLQNMSLGDFPGFLVEGFTLFESHLKSGGARHVPVAEYSLRKKGEKKGLHPS